jgi:electron transfer flavoprotein alpha subunit
MSDEAAARAEAAADAAPRDRAQRKADTLAKLTAEAADVWVASASGDDPYLVPLSLAWIDERIVIALAASSRTGRNITARGAARLALGPTRDVVMIDALLDHTVQLTEDAVLADRYAAQSDWDPREAGGDYVYMVLRPDRIQAWRESNELAGRTLMRNGEWLS